MRTDERFAAVFSATTCHSLPATAVTQGNELGSLIDEPVDNINWDLIEFFFVFQFFFLYNYSR